MWTKATLNLRAFPRVTSYAELSPMHKICFGLISNQLSTAFLNITLSGILVHPWVPHISIKLCKDTWTNRCPTFCQFFKIQIYAIVWNFTLFAGPRTKKIHVVQFFNNLDIQTILRWEVAKVGMITNFGALAPYTLLRTRSKLQPNLLTDHRFKVSMPNLMRTSLQTL